MGTFVEFVKHGRDPVFPVFAPMAVPVSFPTSMPHPAEEDHLYKSEEEEEEED